MPNRIIKESICASEEIDALTDQQEVFFYRLMVVVDDYGLMDARPAMLKAKCYPLKSIDIKCIKEMLVALQAQNLVRLYFVGGKQYLHITNWSKHQQIRAQRAKYPKPEEADAIRCNQLISDAPVIQSNPIQSESESESESNPNKKTAPAKQAMFDTFWSLWPATDRRTQKAKCLAKWKLEKLDAKADEILLHVAALKKTEKWLSGYEPAPLTYLNGRQWEDGLPEIARSSQHAKPQFLTAQQQRDENNRRSTAEFLADDGEFFGRQTNTLEGKYTNA